MKIGKRISINNFRDRFSIGADINHLYVWDHAVTKSFILKVKTPNTFSQQYSRQIRSNIGPLMMYENW